MMYEEFKTIWTRVALNIPMPSIEAYHETIEPFYMAAGMEKDEFVKLYARLPVVVSNVSRELQKLLRAKTSAADKLKVAQDDYNENIDVMEKCRKELEERVAQLSREKSDLGQEVIAARSEIDALHKRHASLVRGLCDKCLEKVLFN